MSVDEAWHHNPAIGIDGVIHRRRGSISRRKELGDGVVGDHDRSVLQDGVVGIDGHNRCVCYSGTSHGILFEVREMRERWMGQSKA